MIGKKNLDNIVSGVRKGINSLVKRANEVISSVKKAVTKNIKEEAVPKHNYVLRYNLQFFASKADIATSSNYRKLFMEKYSNLTKGWQVHHSLPQKYEKIMKASGINIHDIQYLKGVDPKIHSKITNEWAKWEKALRRKPTVNEIKEFAETINNKYINYWFNK